MIIIDEMSMVDLPSDACAFDQQLYRNTLILWEMWISFRRGTGKCAERYHFFGAISVVKLTKIFRQAGESDIVVNAHKINAGEPVILDNKAGISSS